MMNPSPPYAELTDSIEVQVAPIYLPEQSLPDEGIFVYFYAIRIVNHGNTDATLISMNWTVRDGQGKDDLIYADNLLGDQPEIKARESYSYASYCALKTPTGSVRGYYRIVFGNGEAKRIKIPLFFLRPEDEIDGNRGLYQSLNVGT